MCIRDSPSAASVNPSQTHIRPVEKVAAEIPNYPTAQNFEENASRPFSAWYKAVSYTHLDVYKRQN